MAMTTLERLRRDRGLDQVELAAQAGISQSTVSRVENGGAMTLGTARALARVFGITVEDLLDGPDGQEALGTDADEAAVEVLHDVEAAPARGAA